MEQTDTANILVVDDDEIDRELILRSFSKAKIANPVTIACNGVEALDILRGTGGKTKLQRPYLIILDWRMPRMNGAEFLTEVRSDPALKNSVVFVLTTSAADVDIAEAYEHSVNGYIVKKRAGSDFVRMIELLDAFWRVVELPTS